MTSLVHSAHLTAHPDGLLVLRAVVAAQAPLLDFGRLLLPGTKTSLAKPAILRLHHPTETPHYAELSLESLINSAPPQLGFFIHLLIVLKVIISSQECIDTSDHLNRTYLGGTVCQERNHGMTIFLASCWLLLHAALFLDILFPIITNYVRLTAPCKLTLSLIPLANSAQVSCRAVHC